MSIVERVLLVGAGGAMGSVARMFAAEWLGPRMLTTCLVNVSGSFLIGVAVAVLPHDGRLRWLMAVGFLGGYTTFSTFSLEALATFPLKIPYLSSVPS